MTAGCPCQDTCTGLGHRCKMGQREGGSLLCRAGGLRGPGGRQSLPTEQCSTDLQKQKLTQETNFHSHVFVAAQGDFLWWRDRRLPA